VVLVTGAGRRDRPRYRAMMAGNGPSSPRPTSTRARRILPPRIVAKRGPPSTNRRAIAIEADCGDVASIDRMIAHTVAELGRLDVIVNNAG